MFLYIGEIHCSQFIQDCLVAEGISQISFEVTIYHQRKKTDKEMGFYAFVIVKKKPYMNCKWCDLSLFIIIIIKYKKGLVSYMSRYEKLLEVRKLHKYYSKDVVSTKALNGISFDVLKGEYLGIMGASGSGKTTLLNCIATVIKPTSGQILLSGVDISSFDGTKLSEYRGNKIGYLFQDFALLDNLTGKENILLPLSIHNVAMVTAEKKLNEIASFLGITDVLSKLPSQMSGGQKQRVAAARCLISDPDIILADEPTGALDTKAARLLMEKLSEINQKEEHTILMVTHDPNAASFCSRILFIQDGVIFHELRRNIFEETREDFYSRILQVMAQLGGGSANVL